MILNTVVLKVTLIFSCKNSKIYTFQTLLNGETLPRVSKYKYLGHIITEDLCDNNDISRQYKRIYAQGNAFIRRFYMCTESVKCTLFKSYFIVYMPAVVLL